MSLWAVGGSGQPVLKVLMLRELGGVPSSAHLCSTGTLLYVGLEDGSLQVVVLGPADSTDNMLLRGHAGPINGISATTDERSVLSAGEDGSVIVWDVAC